MLGERTNRVDDTVLVDLSIEDEGVSYASTIKKALAEAEIELSELNETIDTVATLKTKCDKLDYALAASSGALCGLIDIFLVGTPEDSPLGKITDKKEEKRVYVFVKHSRWINAKFEGKKLPKAPTSIKAAVRWLEDTFDVPYDQTSWGEAAKGVFELSLNTYNHHFFSLAHNPSICGLFFSILDQFTNTSHFVAGKDFIELEDAKEGFRLRGESFVGKLFCGFCNWFGHIMSDVSGSYGSKERGTRGKGIPSPLWTWMNDVIVLQRKLGITPRDFQVQFNQFALEIYKDRQYDSRFQTAQAIPVIVNSLIVRLLYSVRRLLQYIRETTETERSIKSAWKFCRPIKNPEVSRMLTVAHGTFCLLDLSDATVRAFITGGGNFNPKEFILRLNIVGVGRFAISLGGEVKRYKNARRESLFAKRKKPILEELIHGLQVLAEYYEDKELRAFSERIKCEPEKVFEDTLIVARRRGAKNYDMKAVNEYFSRKK